MAPPPQTVLIIGSPESFKGTVCNLLLKGFRVIYARNASDGVPREVLGKVSLIILEAQVSLTLEIESLPIPIVIVSGNGHGDVLESYLLEGNPIPSADVPQVQMDVGRLFGEGYGPLVTGRVELQELPGFVVLQLNGKHGSSYLDEGIRRALNFMKEHYFEEISLKDIAKAACLSPYHFCRLFKREMGINCIPYLSRLRIEKAKSLLGSTPYSVTQICFEVGFNDLSHFERVFRSIEGVAPTTYRKRPSIQKQEIQNK